MFLGYIHYFRALAIFFIVAGHSIAAFSWESNGEERLLGIFMANGSVLFAGYLFQHLSGRFSPAKYYKSKVKNVIVPYFIISIPAIVIYVAFMQRDFVWPGFYENSVLEQILLFYATGAHLGPLWFIPMITLFYLVAPLLIALDKTKSVYYFLPLFILISCIVDRGGFPLNNFIHFFSAYLLGMYCSKYKDYINPLISRNMFLWATLGSILTLSVLEFVFMSSATNYVNYLQKLAMSMFFLGLFIKYNNSLTSEYISKIADTSFGVFFIHAYVLACGKQIYMQFNDVLPSGNIIAYSLATISTLLVSSAIITFIQNQFGKSSRLIVGS